MMPSYILKPKSDEDFYVRYSTVVDGPCESGTRAEMLAWGTDPARLDRADERGTSALVGEPPWYGWQEEQIHVREGVMDPTEPDDAWWGTVARSDLRAFCATLGDDGNFHPPAGMVTWESTHPTDSDRADGSRP